MSAYSGPGPFGAGGATGGARAAIPGPVMTSWGGFAPSRDDKDRAVPFVVDSPKLTRPLAVTADVTVTLVQVPEATAPELPSLGPNGGAFEFVIAVSTQVLSATPKTL
jgi:hypothetical protein